MRSAKGSRIESRCLTPHEQEKFDEMAFVLAKVFTDAGHDIRLCEAKEENGTRMIGFAINGKSPPLVNLTAAQFLFAPHSWLIDHLKEKLKP